jgi:hypothetical protein
LVGVATRLGGRRPAASAALQRSSDRYAPRQWDRDQILEGFLNEIGINFWKDYLLQTRKEIDLEKTEGTRILHLKILLIGAVLVLVRGPVGLAALVFLPIVMLAMDRMQLSRLHYILQRWEYLAHVVVPRLRDALADESATFFEEAVVDRNRAGFYLPTEGLVRSLLFVPALAVAGISASLLVAMISGRAGAAAYLAGECWLAFLAAISLHHPGVYRPMPTVTVAILAGLSLLLDWTVTQVTVITRLLNIVTKAA